ncbi:MAG: PEP/pyruvate-binding domain-containing protein, partial [bacterium]
MEKQVWLFTEGRKEDRMLLGSKGANLCEMTSLELPVPFGFILTTRVCADYARIGRLPHGVMEEVWAAIREIEQRHQARFGDASNPLLVSVRSGSALSMPGMMDTILNLGLNRETLHGMIRQTGNERFCFDAYRRFIQLFGKVAMGVPDEAFDEPFDDIKKREGVKADLG